jgi:hypothetical protein
MSGYNGYLRVQNSNIIVGGLAIYFNRVLPDHTWGFFRCYTPCTDFTDDQSVMSNFPMWF